MQGFPLWTDLDPVLALFRAAAEGNNSSGVKATWRKERRVFSGSMKWSRQSGNASVIALLESRTSTVGAVVSRWTDMRPWY
jgi:hypothetical protein